MLERDPIGSLIAFNRSFTGRGRDPAWLRAKLDRLCASPFGFLRGTFHLFCRDWSLLGDDPLGEGAPQPIVGDLHLENFGAYRAQSGSVVFDVNDFDESAAGPPALDLGRLATSIVLADEKHGPARALARVEALLAAYVASAQKDETQATDGHGMPEPIKRLIAEAEDAGRNKWLATRVEGAGGERRFKSSLKYFPVLDPKIRAQVADAVIAFAANAPSRPADCPSWPNALDVAVRIAGTGSLGRLRYAVLLPGKGQKEGKEIILELKEARPSGLTPDEDAETQAARVIAHQRLLQGAPPAWLGVASIDGRPFTVRELQPTEAKIDSSALGGADFDELCRACGTVLARLHRRASPVLARRLGGRERSILRRVGAFALRYAEIVSEDHAALVARRAELAAALGV